MNPSAFETARQFWGVASFYPADKEAPDVYGAAHTEAHGFDGHRGQDILEYGCGGGADAMSWLRRGCTVTYCDIVPENVHAATLRIRERFGLVPFDPPRRALGMILAASAALPFEERDFDVVNAHGVLHHLVDPAPVVADFFRVLRPGGCAYVMLYTEHLAARCEPVVAGLLSTGLTREQAFGAVTDGSGCPYARPYTEPEGRALLEAAGFVVDRAYLYNDADFRTFRGVR